MTKTTERDTVLYFIMTDLIHSINRLNRIELFQPSESQLQSEIENLF